MHTASICCDDKCVFEVRGTEALVQLVVFLLPAKATVEAAGAARAIHLPTFFFFFQLRMDSLA